MEMKHLSHSVIGKINNSPKPN